MKKITKLFNIDIKSIDEDKRQVTFCFSDDNPDRMGEIVDQATWDVKNYLNNPLILWGHDPSEPENVLGQGMNLDLNNGGKSFITAQFDEAEVNPRADMVFRQLVKRTLRTVSAGFINHTFEYDADVPVLKDNELLEVSVVPIPANPRAVALALKDGSLSKSDAEWMVKSMKTETEFIEKQLTNDDDVTEKSMEELTEKITALTDLVGKLADSQNSLTETVATLAEANRPAVESDEDKAARAAKEAEDAEAAKEADAAAKAEAEKKAADEAAAKEAEEAEAAKGGSDDQSGAVTDGLSDDAELTPELQAQIDAALEDKSEE